MHVDMIRTGEQARPAAGARLAGARLGFGGVTFSAVS